MNWKRPTFVEVKMDAEIGSYQEDRDPPAEFIARSRPGRRPGRASEGEERAPLGR